MTFLSGSRRAIRFQRLDVNVSIVCFLNITTVFSVVRTRAGQREIKETHPGTKTQDQLERMGRLHFERGRGLLLPNLGASGVQGAWLFGTAAHSQDERETKNGSLKPVLGATIHPQPLPEGPG